MHNPWRDLRGRSHIDLVWTRDDVILDGAVAGWFADESAILMDARLNQVQRRCALAHELAHVEREDGPCRGVANARQEIEADRMAARWLIHIDALLDALKWTRERHEVADECWVTADLLQIRIDSLHASEKHYLRRNLR